MARKNPSSRPTPPRRARSAGGPHELGQNLLIDRAVIGRMVELVAPTDGPITEIGPGDGALTAPLARLGRPLTAVEIDDRYARRLRSRLPGVRVITGDFLDHRLAPGPQVLVGNLPFHQTTAMLRRVLQAPGWTRAVLLLQWEVARRRAGIGGSTLMTAQWLPWFDFRLDRRVPSRAFEPRPGVDGAILIIERRSPPLLPAGERGAYRELVRRVFTGPGARLPAILRRAGCFSSTRAAAGWLGRSGIADSALARDLTVEDWVALYRRT